MKNTVAVIIPTRGLVAYVRQCLKSLFDSGAAETATLDVVVIEGGGEESKALIEKQFKDKPVRWMKAEEDWSYSQINNAAAKTTKSSYILLLNNDTICRPDFLKHMLTPMKNLKDVGIVGCKLMLPKDGGIQHIGVAFRNDGIPYHLGHGKKDDGTYQPSMRDDYYDAVTFACALIRKKVWDKVGGLDEQYFFNYEDTDFCLMAKEAGWKTFMAHKAVVIHIECASLDMRMKHDNYSARDNFKKFWVKWIEKNRITPLVGIKIHRGKQSPSPDRLNIAYVPSSRGAGVPWWRIDLPMAKVAKLGLANVAPVHIEMGETQAIARLEQCDVAHFQGQMQDWVLRIAQMRDIRPFRMLYDYDDHPVHISPYAQAYKFFGCREIKLETIDADPIWLWRDGESGFNVNRNKAARAKQLEIISEVDGVTTTTNALHGYFKETQKNVYKLPNQIDFDIYEHMYSLWNRAPGPVRIGWHGGDNHFHDISSVGKALTDYVNNHDVKLILFGAWYKGPLKGIDPAKVEEKAWVHISGFPYKLATLGIDVGLVPLSDPTLPYMKFNHFKSSIKFLEYSAMRIPTLVAGNREAYDVCEDGVNGTTYESDDEFVEKLHRLCTDKKLRKLMGQRGLDWVREHRDLEKNAHLWLEAYESIMQTGPELSEEVKASFGGDKITSKEDSPEIGLEIPPPAPGGGDNWWEASP